MSARAFALFALCALFAGCVAYDRDRYGQFVDGRATDSSDATVDGRDGTATDGSGCANCGANESCCAGACVNLLVAIDHCGACGNACPGTTCGNGVCTGTCRLGFLDCDRNITNGCETNAGTDPSNCGACGVACIADQVCNDGRCACPSGRADCDGNPANGCESDVSSDPLRCGACGTACLLSQTCSGGHCTCAPGFADCDGNPANGCEVDTRTSATDCGSCGHSCGANGTCTAGACSCETGFLRCPSSATDCNTSAIDPSNCGGCGVTCSGATPVCFAGSCGATCGSGTTLCSGACANPNNDPFNCGGCGTRCTAGANSVATCAAGVCGERCMAGFGDCDGAAANGCETDVRSTNAHCGACGNACAPGYSCISGTCQCGAGLRDCGSRCAACCTDTQCDDGDPCTTDTCNAGACAHNGCGAGLRCCGSACRACCADTDCSGTTGRGCGADGTCSACLAGRSDCDGAATNGCETDTTASVASCGSCGHVCGFANATATCVGGACTLGSCTAGFANCDGNAANGCEVNLNSSNANCGRCGNPCTGTGMTCIGGTCGVTTCPSGRGDCNGSPGDGCETDLATSVANCGACGTTCSFANASASCVGGTCTRGACNAGFGDCDGNPANGCETDLSSAPANCGACGRNCTTANTTAACVAGSCTVTACAPGFGDCDGNATNGCEVDLRTANANCGTCGTVCPSRTNANATCSAGRCGFACSTGFGDCNGVGTDGCESNLATSPANCSTCGNVCPAAANASPTCSGGTCGSACRVGFGDCDGSSANGCETATSTNDARCGTCGVRCDLASYCSASGCRAPVTNGAYTFDTSGEGFTTLVDQPASDVSWDAANRRVRVVAQRTDANDEMFQRALPHQETGATSFVLTARWSTTEQGNWQYAYPIFLAANTVTDLEADPNVIMFRYAAQDVWMHDNPHYELWYRDAAGVGRFWLSWEAQPNTEYHFYIGYDAPTRTLTLRVRSATDVDLASGSYVIGSSTGDGFTLDRFGVATNGLGASLEPNITAWVDDIRLVTY